MTLTHNMLDITWSAEQLSLELRSSLLSLLLSCSDSDPAPAPAPSWSPDTTPTLPTSPETRNMFNYIWNKEFVVCSWWQIMAWIGCETLHLFVVKERERMTQHPVSWQFAVKFYRTLINSRSQCKVLELILSIASVHLLLFSPPAHVSVSTPWKHLQTKVETFPVDSSNQAEIKPAIREASLIMNLYYVCVLMTIYLINVVWGRALHLSLCFKFPGSDRLIVRDLK